MMGCDSNSSENKKPGLLIESIEPGSGAEECGFKSGDILLSINGHPIYDAIDYMYHRGGEEITVIVSRDGQEHACIIEKDDFDDPGIVPAQIDIATCQNKCVFCFVHQQPRGLRGSLYLRDDDYRMSFLFGNYITLTNMSDNEKARILEQRLSPMYVSVHATDREVRNTMLGNPGAPDVMDELKYFTSQGIRVHTQIVLCPGYNDGDVLSATLSTLGALSPELLSIAVVPVGLTAHRRTELRSLNKADAISALASVHEFQAKFLRDTGSRIVYGADELYITAEMDFPALSEYEELPQTENGVGLIPVFLDEAAHIDIDEPDDKAAKCLTFTGTSFFPYLSAFCDTLRQRGYDVTPVEITNTFFGQTVTVAGLLTGRDIIEQLKPHAAKYDRLVVPDIVLREGEHVFLDDLTLNDLADALGIEIAVVEASPYGLLDGVV